MSDQHPAVAFLLAAHERAVTLAEAANESDVKMHPENPVEFILSSADLSTRAIRAGERFIEANMPETVLRRVTAERDILAEHQSGSMGEGLDETECRTCFGPTPGFSGSWPLPWPCRIWLGLAKGWGWTE